jgi:hypothetical protein
MTPHQKEENLCPTNCPISIAQQIKKDPTDLNGSAENQV